MKFSIAVNMERSTPNQELRQIVRQMLELVRLAEEGGFEIAWAAEHHTIELMAGPNPFTFLMDWAAHTSRIRLGTAVVVAPYWHPIRVAGEAALFDIYSDGRLELGSAVAHSNTNSTEWLAASTNAMAVDTARDAACAARTVAGRYRTSWGHLAISTRNLGPQTVADATSADLGGGARSGDLRLGHSGGCQHHGNAAITSSCGSRHPRPALR